MVGSVLVLNADLDPLHQVSFQHAVRMLVRGVVEVYEADNDRVIGVWPAPRVVRLVSYVVARWRWSRQPVWSRQGVLRRDGYRCGYCAAAAVTIDHILPRSRRGQNTWDNTVAACSGCNQRKGDRTPQEAKMTLLWKPSVPAWDAAGVR